MKVGHRILITLAGALWLLIGFFLISMGVRFLLQVVDNPLLALDENKFSFYFFCISKNFLLVNPLGLLIGCSLFVGYLKGHFVFKKAVQKQVTRISKLPTYVTLKHLYSPGYYVLILIMMLFGFGMRFLPITLDTRASIDLAIGTALIYGAMQYFRYAMTSNYLVKKRGCDIQCD